MSVTVNTTTSLKESVTIEHEGFQVRAEFNDRRLVGNIRLTLPPYYTGGHTTVGALTGVGDIDTLIEMLERLMVELMKYDVP